MSHSKERQPAASKRREGFVFSSGRTGGADTDLAGRTILAISDLDEANNALSGFIQDPVIGCYEIIIPSKLPELRETQRRLAVTVNHGRHAED